MKNPFRNAALTLFSLLSPVVLLSNPSQTAPGISLRAENQPLRSVLETISEQTELRFVYHDDLVADRTVRCECRDSEVEEALALVLENTDLAYRMMPPRTVVLYRKAPVPTMTASIIDIQPEVPPRLLYEIEPYYPRLARISGLEGEVVINCLITKTGGVGDTELIQSSGHPSLDAAARIFARRLEFEPARQGEDPVEVWLALEVNFELDARRISPDAYLARIRDLRRQLSSASTAGRDSILHTLLELHTDFVATTRSRQTTDNTVLGELLLPEIRQAWAALWDSQPLHFLVFHDFVLRYPESGEASDAQLSLLYYIQRNIHPYLDERYDSSRAGSREGMFLRHVHGLLKEHYPQALSRELNEAVQAMSM